MLDSRLSELHQYAWAESTTKTLASQWKRYTEFCLRVKLNPMPMDPHVINLFLLHLAIQGLSYSTINNEVSALVTFAKIHRQPIDLRSDFELGLTLKSLRRLLGEKPSRKQELFPSNLVNMFEVIDWSKFTEESAWIGILFLYHSMLRKSHVFLGKFNQNLLQRKDVIFKDWGLIVYVNRTKTIQYQQRMLEIPIHKGGGILCLVSQLWNYFEKYPMPPNEPVLSRKHAGRIQLVDYKTSLGLLKRWAKICRIDKDLGMHSLRRGAATLMSLAGMQLSDIKDRGDWHSTAVLQYLSNPIGRKINIDRQIVQFISQVLEL